MDYHGLMVPACHTRRKVRIASLVWALDGIRRAEQLENDHLSFGMASFLMAGGSLLRDVSPSPLIYDVFSKHECPQKNIFHHNDLVHSHYYQNSETLAHTLKQSLNNFESSTSMELVDQLIHIVSNSQWWSRILKAIPTNYSINFR